MQRMRYSNWEPHTSAAASVPGWSGARQVQQPVERCVASTNWRTPCTLLWTSADWCKPILSPCAAVTKCIVPEQKPRSHNISKTEREKNGWCSCLGARDKCKWEQMTYYWSAPSHRWFLSVSSCMASPAQLPPTQLQHFQYILHTLVIVLDITAAHIEYCCHHKLIMYCHTFYYLK